MEKDRKHKKQAYIRVRAFKPSEVLPFVTDQKSEHEFEGFMVKMNSDRYRMFKAKGMTCVSCGLKGVFFALERTKHSTAKGCNPTRFHFNLYGYDQDGNEVMLTKDHIVPKSKGGNNHIDNYQTMCVVCNEEKADQTKETDHA